MAKSVLGRLTPLDLLKIRDSVAYDPTAPNGLKWRAKRMGRIASGPGKCFWIDQTHYQAPHVVMILNGKWPGDGDLVVTRIDKAGPWGTVENLKWAPRAEALAEGREHNRQELLRKVFGDNVPDLEDRLRLASLCKRGHKWNGYPVSLQFKDGSTWRCKSCHREANPLKRDPNAPRISLQERRRVYKTKIRAELRAQGLTSKGTVPTRTDGGVAKGERNEAIALERALGIAGKATSVARLVMDEQLRYWREHPKAKAKHDRQWAKNSWWLEYQIKPGLRLYHREKSKRRKAVIKDRTAVQITPKQLLQRFAVFGDCCAYCGAGGDLQIEHAVPIAKGGTHAMGNILPACKTCNYSKRDKEIQSWYESQPFFQKARWKKICRVLGWTDGAVNQLALA